MNVVIMAGGGGTRLWPVSREHMPKQFAPLVGKKTLLQLTFARALAVTKSPKNIVVTTKRPYAALVRKQLPKLPRTHILVESVKRDTAPSVGLAAAFFAARNQGEEPLVMVPSDHLLHNESLFRTALRGLGALLRERADCTVLLGAEPTYPETGLGYIERGARVGTTLGVAVHGVRRFAEKPKLPVAKRYVQSGRFLWNMGVYGWRVQTLLELFRKHQPDISRRLQELELVFRTTAAPGAIEHIYAGMPSISVDYAITEKQDVKN
ncbi:MAG: mannose-1-phosphate guanylyltransferase, partial [Parcubacteria group bacterium Gr01-1014_106]